METNEISTWVEQYLENSEGGYYLVDVLWNGKTRKLEVFIDTDEGVTLGECQKISRLMEASLDITGQMPEDYILEVSSPGIERPLKLKRQYVKNIGRIIQVELIEGGLETGMLEKVDEEGIDVKPEKLGLKGRKTTYGNTKLIRWNDIKQTFVQIRF